MAGFIANLMRKNQQRANSNTVAAIKHIPYDSRALEFLSNGIEGGEEECIASAPMRDIASPEFLGRKNFGLGLTYYKGELENNYYCAFRCFTAAFEYGIWEAAYYQGSIRSRERAGNVGLWISSSLRPSTESKHCPWI